MRVAFYGRVSTDDAQDPSLSIPRQLGKCDEALSPIGEKVGVTYWDVESGRKSLSERGNGKRDWSEVVDVPRAGGLPELLASAREGAVDAVIVESIDRLSRMTADGTRIERELEERDVALFAADEPLNSSVTAILTRRVKQGVAEWYVRDLDRAQPRRDGRVGAPGLAHRRPRPLRLRAGAPPPPKPAEGARGAQEAPPRDRPGAGADRAFDLHLVCGRRIVPRHNLREAQLRSGSPPASKAQPQGRERPAADLEQVTAALAASQPQVHRL
jgi:DNA invertase Pin-like site-specific DNA recombinase